jgi:hypothetical protein
MKFVSPIDIHKNQLCSNSLNSKRSSITTQMTRAINEQIDNSFKVLIGVVLWLEFHEI